MPYKDIEKRRKYHRLRHRELNIQYRKKVIEAFGGKCKLCGFAGNIYALQLDHYSPVLRKRDNIHTTTHIWRELARGKTTADGLQLLCANCHAIKTFEDRKNFKQWVEDTSSHDPEEAYK